jgi:hypothetical protein
MSGIQGPEEKMRYAAIGIAHRPGEYDISQEMKKINRREGSCPADFLAQACHFRVAGWQDRSERRVRT